MKQCSRSIYHKLHCDSLLFRVQNPVTVPWDPSLRPATDFLSLTDGLAADNTTGNEPSQVLFLDLLLPHLCTGHMIADTVITPPFT